MFLKNLILKDFRNYNDRSFDFIDSVNLITGNNGVGKTNVIEAISILSGLKSFRGGKDFEIIKWGKKSYYCKAVIENYESEIYETGFIDDGLKFIKKRKINGLEYSISDYFGKLITVIFSPDDIYINDFPPDKRRRYFDSVISKFDKEYLFVLIDYKKILKYRNAVLKSGKDRNIILRDLSVWNDSYCEKAVYISEKRLSFIKKYTEIFSEYYRKFSFSFPDSEFTYKSDIVNYDVEYLRTKLKNNFEEEIRNKSTLIGPHKDDFILTSFDGRKFSDFASQGQKRIASISMRFSENSLVENEKKNKSIILVDDVFSELDKKRKEIFISLINKKNQSIFTMADSVNAGLFSENINVIKL